MIVTRRTTRLFLLFLVVVAGCGNPASESSDLARAMCTLDRVRDPTTMECLPKAGALCGPCGPECPGICVMDGCATVCDDTNVFCPDGYFCDSGYCFSVLNAGCHGCYEDGDCKSGEVCNINNKLCVPTPTGPDARLEMLAPYGVLFDRDMMTLRDLTYTLGFFSERDPAFDPFALKPGECGSQRETLTGKDAPFNVGPLKDAGARLNLLLQARSFNFSPVVGLGPLWDFVYSNDRLMASDFSAGSASWSGSGGVDVGAFTVAGTIPEDFTTTPDVLSNPSASGDVTIQFSPAASEGSWLEISWNETSDSSSTRTACRAPEGATSVTIPAARLTSAPHNQPLNLRATRASVAEFTTRGAMQGRATWGVQQVGTITLQ